MPQLWPPRGRSAHAALPPHHPTLLPPSRAQESEGFLTTRRDDDEVRQREGPLYPLLETAVPEKVFVQTSKDNSLVHKPSVRSILQVELQQANSGEQLKDGTACRLKSIYCGKYVCVEEVTANPHDFLAGGKLPTQRLKVSMARKGAERFDDGTLLELVNADKTEEADNFLRFKGYAYVRHRASGHYLRVREAREAGGELGGGSEAGLSLAHSGGLEGSYTTGMGTDKSVVTTGNEVGLELVSEARLSE